MRVMPITRDTSASAVGVETASSAGMANKSGRPGSGFSLSVLGEFRVKRKDVLMRLLK